MRAAARALTLGLLCALPACGPSSTPGESAPSLAEDARLAWLLVPIPRDGHYDVDTSDTVGILGEVLVHGQRDPMRRARQEMAEEGPAGVAAAQRMIEATWNDPSRFADIRNALDVLSFAATPEAHDIIARVLQHEASTPRQAAWRALRPVAQPSDYDRLRELLDLENPELGPELAMMMQRCDPARCALELLDWIAEDRYPWLWNDLVRGMAEVSDEAVSRRACTLWREQEPVEQAMLAASCARSGDAEALEFLREGLHSSDPAARQLCLEALVAGGRADELAWTLERDPAPLLRQRAAREIADKLEPQLARPLLREGMNDSDAAVAAVCVAELILLGEEAAIERAFQDLSSDRHGALETAMLALRKRLVLDPALAERAFERLHTRAQEEAFLDIAQRRPTLRALGMTPSRRAAEYLDQLSRELTGEIQRTPAGRWLLLQIGNGDEPGQRYLVEQLAVERDPARRLDLIESLAASPTELSRGWLLERAQAEDVPPYELLYIADRLTRVGPARLVAPVLKRATLRVEQDDVRRALQGLLWTWYPGPRGG